MDTDDHKAPISQVENQPTLLVSHYARLTRGAAIRKFWRLFLIGLSVSVAGM
jgi:hypothetical protein